METGVISTEPGQTTDRVARWKGRKQHEVTLESGEVVSIQLPNFPEMLRAGTVPNHLVAFANKAEKSIRTGAEELSLEDIRKATDFLRFLVVTTVKDPVLSEEDVPDMPAEDVDMILEFAMRMRVVDATGRHMAGLERVRDWERFR